MSARRYAVKDGCGPWKERVYNSTSCKPPHSESRDSLCVPPHYDPERLPAGSLSRPSASRQAEREKPGGKGWILPRNRRVGTCPLCELCSSLFSYYASQVR